VNLFKSASANGHGRAAESKIVTTKNPYLPALRAWDDVNHFAIARMRRADFYAMIFALLAVIGWGGMVYYAMQPKLIPYIVHTDKLDQQLAVMRAERLNNIDQDPAVIRASVRTFIFNVRSVTFDPVFQKNMIRYGVRPFVAAGSQAETQVATFYAQNDPFKRAQTNSVEVSVDSPVPMSTNTFQVQWTEHARDAKGIDLGTTYWRGFVTVVLKTSGDEATIMKNPTGMYVTNLQWSQVQGQ
jgi:type IV secretion system protein VirB5